MKAYRAAAWAALAALILAAGSSLARAGRGADAAEKMKIRAASRLTPEDLRKELNLTADQQPQVEQILHTHRQAVGNWRRENEVQVKVLEKKSLEARQAGDTDAQNAAQQELDGIKASLKHLNETFLKQLAEVLTPQQVEKAGELVEPRPAAPVRYAAVLKMLNLTEQQMAKAREILNQAEGDSAKALSPAAGRHIIKETLEKLKKEVLAEPQRDRFDQLMREGMAGKAAGRPANLPADLNLTEEQKAKVEAIEKEGREAAAKAQTPQDKREAVRVMRKRILDEVLTREQRRQLVEKLQKSRRPREEAGSQPNAQ